MKPRTKRWLDAVCVLAIVLVFTLVGGLTWLAREREIAASRAQVANLAVALELYVRGTVSSIDRTLIATGYALRLLPGYPKAAFAAGNRVLADAVAQLGLPVSVYVAGADGELLHSSDGLRHPSNARGREYFHVHAAKPDVGLYVSEMLISRIDGQAMLVFSRRIEDATGGFAGVVTVSAPVSVFERDFSRFDTGRTGSVALGDDAGRLYARRPALPEWVGKVVVRDTDGQIRRMIDQGTGDGVMKRRSAFDGLMRLTGFRRVGDTRLVVTVSASLDEQLATWRLQAWIVGAVAFGLGAGSLLLFTLLTRDLVRKTQLADDLRQVVAALEQSVRAEQSASEAKTAFLSSMSHELMTPLNGIYGAVQLWQLAEKDEGRRQLAGVARTSTERLNTALRDALAYANATSAPVQASLQASDLRELLDEVPALLAAEPGGQACRLDLSPPPAGPMAVHTDPAALRDALRRMLNVAARIAQGTARPAGAAAVQGPVNAWADTSVEAPASAAGVVHVGAVPTRGPDGFRITVEVATEAGSGNDLAAALRPFADSGATESSGLHDAGLSLEVARLLAVRAGAALQVECRETRLAIALAVPAQTLGVAGDARAPLPAPERNAVGGD